MSGASITIDPGSLSVEDALSRLLAAAGNLGPALKNIGEYERQATIDRIAAGFTPAGLPFAPLNAFYAAVEKKGPGILRGASGDLASIVYQMAGDDQVDVGNNVVYGAIHQFGGTIRAKNAAALIFSLGGHPVAVQSVTIPARPYLGISQADELEIIAILSDFFEEAVGGNAGPGTP